MRATAPYLLKSKIMKEITIKVPKTIKYITKLPLFKDGFPSNKIYIKTLPGWGATHGEVKLFPRHSICVNPHLPVIEGKATDMEELELKYPDMFVVHGKVTENEVIEYLEGKVRWKKLLCTPEAYLKKVKPAIEKSKFDLYNDFYMLLDECDKLIKDLGFRPKIEAPMDDFFNFKNKSMISATALVPSDPRFKENGFEVWRITPDYDYSQALELVITNNIITSLQRVIKDNPNQKFFIFINSVTLIHAIIKALDIKEESKVYCSGKSVKKLKREGCENTADKIDGYLQYTFFTSRYFSAVDMFPDDKPIVVMVTDINDEKTMLDPYTDNVQIVGRARNGVNGIYHLTGVNPYLNTIDENKMREYLMDSYSTYNDVKELAKKIVSLGGKTTIKECLDAPEITNIIKEDGRLDHFMIDHFMNENSIRIAYQSQSNLLRSYSSIGNFKVTLVVEEEKVTHQQMLSDYKKEAFQDRCKNVALMIDVWRRPIGQDGKTRFMLGDFIETLEKENPDVKMYYDRLKYHGMEKCGFDKRKMDREIAKLNKKDKFSDNMVRSDVHNSFTLLLPYEEDFIKSRLTHI